MSKFTTEDVRRELERRKATRDTATNRCINCGRSLGPLAALEAEHGLCEDCLMKDDD